MSFEEAKENDEDMYKDKKYWNTYSTTFIKSVEFNLLQSAVALYTHTRSWEGTKILEAGAGSGRPSRMFVNTYMQPGAVYYCSDFSPKFLEFFAEGFKNAEFIDSIRIKFKVIDHSDNVDVEDFDSSENSKRVFLTQADSEKLPFADSTFDRYVSNFSMQYGDYHVYKIILALLKISFIFVIITYQISNYNIKIYINIRIYILKISSQKIIVK